MLRSVVNEVRSSSITVSAHCTERRHRYRRRFVSHFRVYMCRICSTMDEATANVRSIKRARGRERFYSHKKGKTFRADRIPIENTK